MKKVLFLPFFCISCFLFCVTFVFLECVRFYYGRMLKETKNAALANFAFIALFWLFLPMWLVFSIIAGSFMCYVAFMFRNSPGGF